MLFNQFAEGRFSAIAASFNKVFQQTTKSFVFVVRLILTLDLTTHL